MTWAIKIQIQMFVVGCLVSLNLTAETAPLRVSVTKVTASVDGNFEDDEYFHIRMDSDLVVRNTQRTTVLVARMGGQVTQIDERVVDSTKGGKTWTKLTQTSWFDDGTQQFYECQELASGRSAAVHGIKASLFLRKNEYKLRTSNELKLRIHLDLVCRENRTKDTLAVHGITEEFKVKVPIDVSIRKK